MGGGDLNSKKSWHPNTMKNQERVWKAEQAAAEEKKRIMELQNERAAERDRSELNSLVKRSAGVSGDDRLHWMYDKPDKKGQDEDYLLGRSIEKNFDQPEKSDDVIPAVARRVVGSSMSATASGDTQVDLARKIREDPLLLVKERERAARAALLNNPIHRKRLTELLRKEQELKGKTNKKVKKKNQDLDDKLTSKLNALGGEKGLNLVALLASGDSSSSSDSEEEEKPKKKRKKKHYKKKSKKSKKNRSNDSQTNSSDDDKRKRNKIKDDRKREDKKKSKKSKQTKDTASGQDRREKNRARSQRGFSPDNRNELYKKESRKRRSDSHDSDKETKHKRGRREERRDAGEEPRKPERTHQTSRRREDSGERRSTRTPEYSTREESAKHKRVGVSMEERSARLAAMAAAGAEREQQRSRRVEAQRAADRLPPPAPAPRAARPALPASLESRIHSNRHYIQRNTSHMNEHFARR